MLRLRDLGLDVRPKFYDGPDGRLTFRLRTGWRPDASLTRGLERIDDVVSFL